MIYTIYMSFKINRENTALTVSIHNLGEKLVKRDFNQKSKIYDTICKLIYGYI